MHLDFDLQNVASRNQLSEFYLEGLLNDTLPFWTANAVDRSCGGFITALNCDGTVLDTDKSVWHQGRFTWLLGELYNEVEPKQEWLDLALHGIRFLEDHCLDPVDGRMWFHLTQDGKPIRKRRYAFSESFAAIAFGEVAKATQEQRLAERAAETFQRFIDHSRNPIGVQPKFTDTRPTRGLGVPMITIVTAQELRDSIQLTTADELIDQAIDDIKRFHLKPDIKSVMETVGLDGELIDHFDGRTLNPGHAIEAAWFIMLEGKLRSRSDYIELGCQMLDWMWERGWDREYGGLLYFVDVQGLPVQEYWHDMKFWWPHNEAIIATLMAFLLTGEPRYAEMHRLVHDWSYQHFPDPEHGEWFGYLHRDGRISTRLKGNLWKGPFHLPRMQLLCWKMLSDSSWVG